LNRIPGRDAEARKSAGISRINRGRTWNRDGTDGGVIVGIFPRLALSPHLSFRSFTYLFHLSLSLSLSLCRFSRRVAFHLYSLPFQRASYPIAQLYRSGRGCSDPRRRSSEPWVVATPYLLSCPSPPRPSTAVPLHLANCLHFSPARDFIRPQRREIKPFWDIYEWIATRGAHAWSLRRSNKENFRPYNATRIREREEGPRDLQVLSNPRTRRRDVAVPEIYPSDLCVVAARKRPVTFPGRRTAVSSHLAVRYIRSKFFAAIDSLGAS